MEHNKGNEAFVNAMEILDTIDNLGRDKNFTIKDIQGSTEYIQNLQKLFTEIKPVEEMIFSTEFENKIIKEYKKFDKEDNDTKKQLFSYEMQREIRKASRRLEESVKFLRAYEALDMAKNIKHNTSSLKIFNIVTGLKSFNTSEMFFPYNVAKKHNGHKYEMVKKMSSMFSKLNNARVHAIQTLYERTDIYKEERGIFWAIMGGSIVLTVGIDMLAVVFYQQLKEVLAETILSSYLPHIMLGINIIIPVLGGFIGDNIAKNYKKEGMAKGIANLISEEKSREV